MKRRSLLALLVLGASGCLTPLTSRLDRIHERMEDTNQQLVEVTAQLNEANRRLAQANQKLEDIERLLKRFPGLGQNADSRTDPRACSSVPASPPTAETRGHRAVDAPGDPLHAP
jgi:hypothetical protein